MNSSIAPVKNKERIVFMDVLRGLAILGILIANLTMGGLSWGPNKLESGPYFMPELDKSLSFLYAMFIDGKFYSIFSLLFGWGIALQIQRGMNGGLNPIPTIKRRLMFMLLLGFVHILIWPGDIVLFYAILGFMLLPFRRFTDKTLVITGASLILLPIFLYAAKLHWPVLNTPSLALKEMGNDFSFRLTGIDSEESFKLWVEQANWWDLLQSNFASIFYRFSYLLFISRIPKVLGMFLIGYALGRSNFYQTIIQNKKWAYRIIGLGLLIGLPANYFLAQYMTYFEEDYFTLKPNGFYQTLSYAFGVASLAIAYVGILLLVFQTTFGERILSIFAPVGKMAFSNYMMHSIVCNFVFLPMGLGYGGQVGTFYLTIFGLLLFTFQILLSTYWLRYYNYGPVEWLWRSLTYRTFQRMRK